MNRVTAGVPVHCTAAHDENPDFSLFLLSA